MIRSVYDVASVIAKYRLSVTNIEFYAMRKSKEKERKRGRGRHLYQAEIYVTAHTLMTECVSVCVHPDIRVWSRGFGHLLTGRDPLCAYERKRSERCAPREKESRGVWREIKRDGRHPSLIDEHRSHWDVPERRSNKARARINARERSRERNTCLFRPVDTLKGSGPRGEKASWPLIHIHSRAKQTDRASSIGDNDLYEVIEID